MSERSIKEKSIYYRIPSNAPEIPEKIPIKTVRTFFPGSPGSITVEASVVLPVFMMALIGFAFFFHVMTVQLRLQSVLDGCAGELAGYTHVKTILPATFAGGDDEGGGIADAVQSSVRNIIYSAIGGAYLKACIMDEAGRDWLNRTMIRGGADGITCTGAIVYDGADLVLLTINYRMDIPFVPGQLLSIDLSQSSMRRLYTGYEREPETEPEAFPSGGVLAPTQESRTVYVSKYGKVYHLYRDCMYLKREIKAVTIQSVGDYRNDQGGKYYPCRECIHGSPNAIVYITTDGERYHNTTTCGALIRYISQVKEEDAGGKPLCSSCEKRKTKEGEGGE